jgi:two-component system C4-dicarboxylate transport response regulator DctD
MLLEHFMLLAASRYGRLQPKIPPAQLRQLMARDWPGNVRELRNVADALVLGVGAEVAVVRREGVPVTLAVGRTVAETQGVLLPVPGPREPVPAALGVPVREEEGQGVADPLPLAPPPT